MPRILITDLMHDSIVDMLREQGFEVDYRPAATRREILELLPGCAGLIVRSKTAVDRELITAGPELKFIARSGAGLDLIDLEFAANRGISILHAAEGNRNAVAEHTIGMLLALMRNMIKADREVRRQIWNREGNRGMELMHRCVGIIGYGHMGSAFAHRLSGFNCRVLAYDKYRTGYGNGYVVECDLTELFDQCDVVSLHIPLSDETRGYYNSSFFAKFRNNIILLNTARGEILPLDDLLGLLKSGKVMAAGLDVLENENLKRLTEKQKVDLEELTQMENVILSPHVAGWTRESYVKINQTLLKKISSLKLV